MEPASGPLQPAAVEAAAVSEGQAGADPASSQEALSASPCIEASHAAIPNKPLQGSVTPQSPSSIAVDAVPVAEDAHDQHGMQAVPTTDQAAKQSSKQAVTNGQLNPILPKSAVDGNDAQIGSHQNSAPSAAKAMAQPHSPSPEQLRSQSAYESNPSPPAGSQMTDANLHAVTAPASRKAGPFGTPSKQSSSPPSDKLQPSPLVSSLQLNAQGNNAAVEGEPALVDFNSASSVTSCRVEQQSSKVPSNHLPVSPTAMVGEPMLTLQGSTVPAAFASSAPDMAHAAQSSGTAACMSAPAHRQTTSLSTPPAQHASTHVAESRVNPDGLQRPLTGSRLLASLHESDAEVRAAGVEGTISSLASGEVLTKAHGGHAGPSPDGQMLHVATAAERQPVPIVGEMLIRVSPASPEAAPSSAP